ncbi:integral membrane protein [Colletotrichum tofieldiae]|nr:integral membrane protein [Colletotrichum tofieldiae]
MQILYVFVIRIGIIFLIFHFLQTIVFLFLIIFQCIPIQAIWDKELQGHCLNISSVGYGGAALSILNDIILIIIPIPELMKLQLGQMRRIEVAFMFGMGSL